VDEEPLPLEVRNGNLCWRWQPGFYAGQVRAELRSGESTTIASYILDVSPDRKKLGRDHFSAMVNELRAFQAGLLLGDEPPRIAVGAAGDFSSLNLEYGRLRAYGTAFATAIRQVTQRPLSRLKNRRHTVAVHLARRIDQHTLSVLARSPHVASVLPNRGNHSLGELRLDVPSSAETVDIAANRTLLYFLRAVQARLRRVRVELVNLALSPEDDPTRSGTRGRLPERLRYLDQVEASLRVIGRRPPFRELSASEISPAGLNAISASPTYARAHRLAWWILRHGIDAAETNEAQWMIPTWEVFERWCFLEVLRQASAVLNRSIDDWKVSFYGADSVRAALRTSTIEVELRLQDRFPAWDNGTSERISISGERRPDLTLSWSRPDGSSDWIALDAKYRVSRGSVLEGMVSAHLYHDALRIKGQPPALALLLTPGPSETVWLMDLDFISRERVGIVSVGGGQVLRELLSKLLGRIH
jgi:hypothetical protein